MPRRRWRPRPPARPRPPRPPLPSTPRRRAPRPRVRPTRSRARLTSSTTTTAPRCADPYRWLEDPTAPETRRGSRPRTRSRSATSRRSPPRALIKQRLTELWNYEQLRRPFERGRTATSITRNDGLQNQSVLYAMDSLDGEPRVLLDPEHAVEGRHRRPGRAWRVSDGRQAAGLRPGRGRLRLAGPGRSCDVDTGQGPARRPVEWIKFSGASWTKDGKGFFYSRFDEPKAGASTLAEPTTPEALLPPLGTPQADDVLVYERAGPPANGASAAPSPTTAATWSSTSPHGTDARRSRLLQGPDASPTPRPSS